MTGAGNVQSVGRALGSEVTRICSVGMHFGAKRGRSGPGGQACPRQLLYFFDRVALRPDCFRVCLV